MKCYICDCTLADAEIQWNDDHGDWEPCFTCQNVIDDVFEPLSELEIDTILAIELGEDFFDPDTEQESITSTPSDADDE